MNYIILGNSLVRNLAIPNVQVISINGLDWESAISYMINHRAQMRDHYVFIVVGPLRFTSLHRSRREVVFRDTNLRTVKQLFAPFYRVQDLAFLRIYPIPFPLFPMNFVKYNSRCARPIMRGFYPESNKEIRGHIVVENRAIYYFNTTHELNTPHLHAKIFKRTKGRYQFLEKYLRDGLHVRNSVIRQWKHEFQRVIRVMDTRAENARQE